MGAGLAMALFFKPLFVLRLTAHETVSGATGILGAAALRAAEAVQSWQEPLQGTGRRTSQQLLVAMIVMALPCNPEFATTWPALVTANG